MRIGVAKGEHVVDLLNCREADHSNGVARVFLLRDDVLCLAVLRDKLSVRRTADLVEVTGHDPAEGCEVRVCDKDGQALLSRTAIQDTTRFDLRQVAQAGIGPACVKLLRDGLLLDVEAMPPAE